MYKIEITYVDSHVIIANYQNGAIPSVRVFDCSDDSVEFVRSVLDKCFAPTEPTQ